MEEQEIRKKIKATPLQKRVIEKFGEEFKSNLAFYCEGCAEHQAHHMTRGIKIHAELPEIFPQEIFPISEALDEISGYSYLHTIPGKKVYYCDDCFKIYLKND